MSRFFYDLIFIHFSNRSQAHRVKPVKILNLNFKKKKKGGGGGKTVNYWNSPEKSWDFSRSQMKKRIASLESSLEI